MNKTEVDALRFQLQAVEDALRSTVDKHENDIMKIQEDHESELKETEIRMSSQFARMSVSQGGVDIHHPSLIAEENEYDLEEDEKQKADKEENEKMADIIKSARESVYEAEILEASAKDKVNELEAQLAMLMDKLKNQEQDSADISVSPEITETTTTESNIEPTSEVKVDEVVSDKVKLEMLEAIEVLEKELVEAREKVVVVTEKWKITKAEAETAELAKEALQKAQISNFSGVINETVSLNKSKGTRETILY